MKFGKRCVLNGMKYFVFEMHANPSKISAIQSLTRKNMKLTSILDFAFVVEDKISISILAKGRYRSIKNSCLNSSSGSRTWRQTIETNWGQFHSRRVLNSCRFAFSQWRSFMLHVHGFHVNIPEWLSFWRKSLTKNYLRSKFLLSSTLILEFECGISGTKDFSIFLMNFISVSMVDLLFGGSVFLCKLPMVELRLVCSNDSKKMKLINISLRRFLVVFKVE